MLADSPLLDRVVHDSNNLGDPPQRRINMSMVDNGRRKLTVLNATAEETSRCVGSSEVRRWQKELKRHQSHCPCKCGFSMRSRMPRGAGSWTNSIALTDFFKDCPYPRINNSP